MKLKDHLQKIHSAPNAEDLEKTFRDGFDHFRKFRTSNRIRSAVRIRGKTLCALGPHSRLVPVIGKYRKMSLCGKTYSIGFGGNSTGERYVWHYAKDWARKTLIEDAGLDAQLSESIIEWAWSGYPHRSLIAIEKAMAHAPQRIPKVRLKSPQGDEVSAADQSASLTHKSTSGASNDT